MSFQGERKGKYQYRCMTKYAEISILLNQPWVQLLRYQPVRDPTHPETLLESALQVCASKVPRSTPDAFPLAVISTVLRQKEESLLHMWTPPFPRDSLLSAWQPGSLPTLHRVGPISNPLGRPAALPETSAPASSPPETLPAAASSSPDVLSSLLGAGTLLAVPAWALCPLPSLWAFRVL